MITQPLGIPTPDADAILALIGGITVSDVTREEIQMYCNGSVSHPAYIRGLEHNPESAIAIHPHIVSGAVRLSGTRMAIDLAYFLVADPAYRTKGDDWLFAYLERQWPDYTRKNILLSCWYAATYGPRKLKRAWRDWLRSGEWDKPDGTLPPPIANKGE